jgi:fermentation-respiration switch protein FrsA (DUF1100 family)
MLWTLQRRLIYFPFGDVPPPGRAGLPAAQTAAFATDDGLTLNGWYVPAMPPGGRWTVIVFNGNAGHRGMRAPLAAALAGRHVASFLFDYRGYGGNPGSPSEAGLALDARAARRYVESRPDVDPSRIAYYGESLGSGVAVRLAAERPPAALILRSPFTSLTDVGRHHYPYLPVSWLLEDRFETLERLQKMKCPVLVIAAEDDSIVPARLSRRLYEAANEPKQLLTLPDADHNDYELLAGPRLVDAVTKLLSAL